MERCYRDKIKMKNIIIASRIDPGERSWEELGYRVFLHQTCDMTLHLTSVH